MKEQPLKDLSPLSESANMQFFDKYLANYDI